MNLLIIGGTRFLGRHFVESARDGGHTVTLFHRGQTGEDLFPGLEHLHGDREIDLSPLAGRRWDAVVDTSGYLPQVVQKSARPLATTCSSPPSRSTRTSSSPARRKMPP